jgi:hypothetical protein
MPKGPEGRRTDGRLSEIRFGRCRDGIEALIQHIIVVHGADTFRVRSDNFITRSARAPRLIECAWIVGGDADVRSATQTRHSPESCGLPSLTLAV